MNPDQASETPTPTGSGDAARVATWFVVKLVVLTLLLGLGEALLMQQSRKGAEAEWLFLFREAVATCGAWLAGLLDSNVSRDSVAILGNSMQLVVSLECTALFAKALFCAAAIAYPATWRHRLIGCVVGVIGVAVLNVLRIAMLFQPWIRSTTSPLERSSYLFGIGG